MQSLNHSDTFCFPDWIEKYQKSNITDCALKDNCVKIEGVRGAVRDVNGSEQNIQKKKKSKKENFFQGRKRRGDPQC